MVFQGRQQEPMADLQGKTIFITGSSRGIGREIALRCARDGANLVITGKTAEPHPKLPGTIHSVAKEVEQAGGRALAIQLDVRDADALHAAVEQTAQQFGGIDVLVNNAGANRRGPIEGYNPAELAAVVQTNLTAPIVLTRLALPYLRKRGRGAVVNVASIAGHIPVLHEAVYSATKFGLRAFTYALAEELEGSGVTVSAVSPGPVDTGFIMDEIDEVPDLVFAQPMSSAEDVAKLVLDCAADGVRERVIPRVTGYLATVGFLFPSLRKLMVPMMERQGKRVKEEYRKRKEASS